MAWSISDLDKSKTEACIQNERIRLDNCNETLTKLKEEYDRKRFRYMAELSDLENKITGLENVIKNGERFIENCEEHLKSFEKEG